MLQLLRRLKELLPTKKRWYLISLAIVLLGVSSYFGANPTELAELLLG